MEKAGRRVVALTGPWVKSLTAERGDAPAMLSLAFRFDFRNVSGTLGTTTIP
jgi:hypothetical protein